MEYLRDCWYATAQSTELTRTPLRRVILGEPLVLFRNGSGVPVALLDRCPHRFAPLSRGRVIGDGIECGYHGLRFGTDGVCIHNPHGAIPPAAKVKSFPVAESLGFVWIWAGKDSKPDSSRIPPFAAFDDNPAFLARTGYLRVAANYELITDNLLDLSHVEFIHPAFRTESALENTRLELLQEGDVVQCNRWKPNSAPSSFMRLFWESKSATGDGRANMMWLPPAYLCLDLGVTEVGRPVSEGVSVPFMHLLTPETATSTHYFWAVARNCRLDDEPLTEKMLQIAIHAFENEDEPMIVAQQVSIGPQHRPLMELNPVLLAPDAPAVRARRTLASKIRQQNSQTETEADVGQVTELPGTVDSRAADPSAT